MQTTCSAPAKLILSGEHAILHQCPALSMAIQLHTHCHCHFKPSETSSVTIELKDFQQKHSFPFTIWHKLAVDVETRYTLFENEHAAIQSVLAKPVDLIVCTLHHFNQFHSLKKGEWSLSISSEIPIGRGLGSSAAIIVSILNSLFIHHDIKPDKEVLLALSRKIEARQHGRSSGVDPATIIYGGLLEFHSDRTTKKHQEHAFKGWLINTGYPESTTGQSVIHVQKHFSKDKKLWKDFAKVTDEIIQAWDSQDSEQLLLGVQKNQALLEHIDVVPNQVKEFITALSVKYDATAKICGAGSIKGSSAGSVLCFSQQEPKALCEEYGYSYQPICIDNQGALCQRLK